MGPRPLHLRRVPDLRHHRPLLQRRALADRRAVPQEHHALVRVSVDAIGRRSASRRARHGGVRSGPDVGDASFTQSWKRSQLPFPLVLRRGLARRLCRRLSRLLRLRCHLAELLLLAGRRGKERMALGAGVLHRGLFRRRRTDVQHGAARAQRNPRHGLAKHMRRSAMTMKHVLLAGTAALAMLATPSLAPAQTIDTRVGKLELQVGYPSKATVENLFDEMDFQRATQAFIWALPAVGFHGLHLAHRNTFGAKDGEVVLYQSLKDKAGMLTPNLTTLYLM